MARHCPMARRSSFAIVEHVKLFLFSFFCSAGFVLAQEHSHSSTNANAETHSATAHHHEMKQENAMEHHHEAHVEGNVAHGHGMDHQMAMEGFLGAYAMTREASGTSWQPEASPHEGLHWMASDWMLMAHGFADLIYDHQGGHRGDNKLFSVNMGMFMAQRSLGAGKFGFRSMFSLEPATIGKEGYPELLQTGETANGKTPLIDRQHPHDLFMELALTYSHPVTDDSSAFGYFGFPGEPALGPSTFMHRFSGMDNPEAPITHHWLDSTHITFGVVTLGYIWKDLKVDGSIFTGREPDEQRWNFDEPRFDSYSIRLSYNPTTTWAFQLSYGWLNSPEQLEPDVNVDRITASVSYHKSWRKNHWQTTLAWGQNRNHPGAVLDGFLLESTVRFHDTHTLFGRAERVEKDEFFPVGHPLDGSRFTVNKVSLGYIYDFPKMQGVTFGVGGLGSVHLLPEGLEPAYGDTPLSCMLFVRAKL